uniref:GTP-binding protein n=1 Tax=Thermofilum pendens TaxID=2269 RepID=A0A7J3X4W4_THEPE
MQEMSFRGLKVPPSSDELFERAVRACREASQAGGRSSLDRAKKRYIRCVRSSSSLVVSSLREIYKTSPYIERLHPFYRELCSIAFDVDTYRLCLSRVRSVERIVRRVALDSIQGVKAATEKKEAVRARRSFFGRLGSLLESLDDCLKLLREAALRMKEFPEVNTEVPSVIIAGAPNVGKSSLLRALTRAKPEVKPYPFTTKSLILGMLDLGVVSVQLIDTPGLLDTPLEEKSKIERQAILALRHLGDAVVFVADPTETCGFPLDFQRKVFVQVADLVKGAPVLLVANKLDIASEEHLRAFEEAFENPEYLAVSAEKKINLDKLVDKLRLRLRSSAKWGSLFPSS